MPAQNPDQLEFDWDADPTDVAAPPPSVEPRPDTGPPAPPPPEPGEQEPAHDLPAPLAPPRRRPTHASLYAPPSGAVARANANLAALALEADLEFGDDLTPQQLATLASWSGWGALPEVFDHRKRNESIPTRLRELLTDSEINDAAQSTQYAHYTTPQIASAMWQAALNAGFAGGKVLEPGCGHGVFFAAAPTDLPIELHGVEQEPRTARIAQLLHPDATIFNGEFQKYNDSGFSLVIGNVPFASTKPYDRMFNQSRLSLHNYFINKSLALCRPGGLVFVISSMWTLNAQSARARETIASQGQLLGAVRLHNRTFLEHSGAASDSKSEN